MSTIPDFTYTILHTVDALCEHPAREDDGFVVLCAVATPDEEASEAASMYYAKNCSLQVMAGAMQSIMEQVRNAYRKKDVPDAHIHAFFAECASRVMNEQLEQEAEA